MSNTVFDLIIARRIDATIIFEDHLCMAIRAINPVSPVHFVVIPKDKQGLT